MSELFEVFTASDGMPAIRMVDTSDGIRINMEIYPYMLPKWVKCEGGADKYCPTHGEPGGCPRSGEYAMVKNPNLRWDQYCDVHESWSTGGGECYDVYINSMKWEVREEACKFRSIAIGVK